MLFFQGVFLKLGWRREDGASFRRQHRKTLILHPSEVPGLGETGKRDLTGSPLLSQITPITNGDEGGGSLRCLQQTLWPEGRSCVLVRVGG